MKGAGKLAEVPGAALGEQGSIQPNEDAPDPLGPIVSRPTVSVSGQESISSAPKLRVR
jgi:hypothetical protein